MLIVEDARRDDRFTGNPLVTGDLSIRFYAGAPLITSSGHALGTLCVIDQEPRALTDEARHALEILSREVVSQLELRRALRELDRTRIQQLELKDRLLSHVSHELRSPLTVISQFASILLDGLAGALTPTQRDYLDIVNRNTNQLRLMIGDLIEVSRLKTGKFGLDRTPIAVDRIIDEVVQSLQVSAGTRGIELSSVMEPELPLVHADPARVKQILTNLIENALKFTPEGGTVTVEATMCPDTPDMVRVSVEDTGCGIAPAERDRIFDELYQVEEKHPEARKGLGLGLHICKDLVSMHGGTIWVEGEPERGAAFRFTLPVISVTEWISGFLARRPSQDGRLSLVSVDCGQSNGAEHPSAAEDLSNRARLTLHERLPQEHLLVPQARRGEPSHVLFVLAAVDHGAGTQLADEIRAWLATAHAPSTEALAIETRVHPVPQRNAKGDDPCRATATAVVRVMDELVRGLERKGAA
jgi:signal transduction histidine kinase